MHVPPHYAHLIPVISHHSQHLRRALETLRDSSALLPVGLEPSMTPGKRLKRARLRQGLTIHQLEERTGIKYRTIRAHEDGQNGIGPEAAELYAQALNTTPEFLLFGRRAEVLPQVARVVPVLGDVQAGVWREVPAEPPEPDTWVPFADPAYVHADSIWALQIAGPSMNRHYTEGGFVIVVDVTEAGVREGDHVVVRRMRNGLVEMTLKEVVRNGKTIELWPRSTDPRFQGPLRLGGADDVRIIGVVVGAYKRGPERTGPLIYP